MIVIQIFLPMLLRHCCWACCFLAAILGPGKEQGYEVSWADRGCVVGTQKSRKVGTITTLQGAPVLPLHCDAITSRMRAGATSTLSVRKLSRHKV